MAEQAAARPMTEQLIQMKANGSKIVPTIDRFVEVLHENYDGYIRMNEMVGRPEYNGGDGEWRAWTDAQESMLRSWFQSEIGMYSQRMMTDALNIYFESQKVNPLTDLLDSLEWDGTPRIEHFLTEAVKADDNAYNRECSRLIFAGGVHRAYRPGCKFDDMIVLVGRQGGGKSTIVRWLNIEDEYFHEVKVITGKEGIEALRGVWIGEVAELMAMTRVKESEAVKAFITSQEDAYRAPYDRHVQVIPRRCLFIGTTNNDTFLSDKTGNRRFYPVLCREDGYDLLGRETVLRAYIRQCWAEAVVLFKRGELSPYARRDLRDVIRSEQRYAEEDDWRVGAIKQYLDDAKRAPNAVVCIVELWHRALNEPPEKKPGRSDQIEIAKIMTDMPGWERRKNPVRMDPWGQQRVFQKKQNFYPFW